MEIPRLTLPTVTDNPMCFGCGESNPMSLKLKFHADGDTARGEFLPNENHQSWPGFVHGGVLMAVADEAIGYATFLRHIYCVTARFEMRIKSMAKIGEKLYIVARITKLSSRLAEVEVTLKRQDGSIVGEANSTQFIVNTGNPNNAPI